MSLVSKAAVTVLLLVCCTVALPIVAGASTVPDHSLPALAGDISQLLGTLQRAEQNALNTLTSQLTDLQTQAAAGGPNNTVSTSSVQQELANSANLSQITSALMLVESDSTAVSSWNQQLMSVLQAFR